MRQIFWIGMFLLMGVRWEVHSQLALGLVTGNYSGSSALAINPSLTANTRLKADISVFSLHAFAENNYLYFPKKEASFVKLFNGDYKYPLIPKPYGTGERRVYAYYRDRSDKNIFGDMRITGPSAMITHQDHIFALTTSFRSASSTCRVPYDMANFMFYGMDFKPQHNKFFSHENFDQVSMSWMEIKFSYAAIFKRSHNNHWSAGVSLGPVFSFGGFYMTGNDISYIAYNDSILNIENADTEFGFALPIDYTVPGFEQAGPTVLGRGAGLDFGITWQHREKPYQKSYPRNCYKRYFESYKIKIGMSVMDLGWVTFSKNAEKHVFTDVSNNWINVNMLEYNSVRHEMNTMSALFYGDSTASLSDHNIRIYLPATFSVQADYHLTDWWYINGILMVPVHYASPMVERPFVVAVTPRFESDYLEINVPLVLYNYKYPRVGLSVRFEGLTIGCDNLACFSKQQDFTGADIYIAYKVNLRVDEKNPFIRKGACYNTWRTDVKKAQNKTH